MVIIKLTHLQACAQNAITLVLLVLTASNVPVAILQNLELLVQLILPCVHAQMGTMILEIKSVLYVPIIVSHALTLLPALLATPTREIFCKIVYVLMVSMMMESTMLANPAYHNV